MRRTHQLGGALSGANGKPASTPTAAAAATATAGWVPPSSARATSSVSTGAVAPPLPVAGSATPPPAVDGACARPACEFMRWMSCHLSRCSRIRSASSNSAWQGGRVRPLSGQRAQSRSKKTHDAVAFSFDCPLIARIREAQDVRENFADNLRRIYHLQFSRQLIHSD